MGCKSLASINILNPMSDIAKDAFDDTAWYNSQPDGVIYIDSILFSYKGTMPENTSIVLKDGTEYIVPQIRVFNLMYPTYG